MTGVKQVIFLSTILIMGSITSNAQSKATTQRDTLTVFREKINQLDKDIVHLLGERMKAARAIGEYKKSHDMQVLQTNRFSVVLEQAIAAGKEEGLSEEFIRALFADIHKESIRQQEALKR
jgi:chorismate mutase